MYHTNQENSESYLNHIKLQYYKFCFKKYRSLNGFNVILLVGYTLMVQSHQRNITRRKEPWPLKGGWLLTTRMCI